jgi:hypothetical protein
MHVCTTADPGPGFIAWTAIINGTSVAVVTPAAADDDSVWAQVSAHLGRAGINCGTTCLTCPVGRLRAGRDA